MTEVFVADTNTDDDPVRVVERTVTIKFLVPVTTDEEANETDPTKIMTDFVGFVPRAEADEKFSVVNRELSEEEADKVSHDLLVSALMALLLN